MVMFTFMLPMDEEHEEFFDSLDEGQCSEDTVNKSSSIHNCDIEIPPSPMNSVWKRNEITEANNKMPRSKIPIYVGHDEKELIVNLESKHKIKQYSSSSTISTKSSKFKINNVTLPKIKPAKTYLGIFHAKHGIGQEKSTKSVTDSARAVYEGTTARTLSSFKSCSSINEPVWDTVSMYENYMVKNIYPNKEDSCNSRTKSIISEVDIDNLLSVSEACMFNKKEKLVKNKTKGCNVYVLKPPMLGGLGPDLESIKAKMNKLRRQQEYGKQVDIRNRVKIIQKLAKENRN